MSLKILPVSDIPKCQETPLDDLLLLFKVCSEMETLCTKENGLGLSACQVGIPWNLFVYLIDPKKNYYKYYVNCNYVSASEEKIVSIEGCLSLRDKKGELRRFEVKRNKSIVVSGFELKTNPDLKLHQFSETFSELPSIVLQHEIDHGFGITIDNIGEELFLTQITKKHGS